MTTSQQVANPAVPSAFLRKKISDGIARAWADTDAGPLDPLRESDLLDGGMPGYDTFALTMPMPLPAR